MILDQLSTIVESGFLVDQVGSLRRRSILQIPQINEQVLMTQRYSQLLRSNWSQYGADMHSFDPHLVSSLQSSRP